VQTLLVGSSAANLPGGTAVAAAGLNAAPAGVAPAVFGASSATGALPLSFRVGTAGPQEVDIADAPSGAAPVRPAAADDDTRDTPAVTPETAAGQFRATEAVGAQPCDLLFADAVPAPGSSP